MLIGFPLRAIKSKLFLRVQRYKFRRQHRISSRITIDLHASTLLPNIKILRYSTYENNTKAYGTIFFRMPVSGQFYQLNAFKLHFLEYYSTFLAYIRTRNNLLFIRTRSVIGQVRVHRANFQTLFRRKQSTVEKDVIL